MLKSVLLAVALLVSPLGVLAAPTSTDKPHWRRQSDNSTSITSLKSVQSMPSKYGEQCSGYPQINDQGQVRAVIMCSSIPTGIMIMGAIAVKDGISVTPLIMEGSSEVWYSFWAEPESIYPAEPYLIYTMMPWTDVFDCNAQLNQGDDSMRVWLLAPFSPNGRWYGSLWNKSLVATFPRSG